MKTVYIISLKFAPGLYKEFRLLGENIRKNGVHVTYLISDRYKELEGGNNFEKAFPFKQNIKGMLLDCINIKFLKTVFNIFKKNPPFFVCFYNPHPLNPLLSRLMKHKFSDVLISIYLHDPYKENKRLYGRSRRFYYIAVEFIQKLTVLYSDYVISPSKLSAYLYKREYKKTNAKNFIAPLLVPDLRKADNNSRHFFSIVGSIHTATGHDRFFKLVEYAYKNRMNYNFAIISSTDINKYFPKLNLQEFPNLKVINNDTITDAAINELVSKSYAIFRLDSDVTQSGVIPVSFMNKTPVIARNIPGLKQHIDHQNNGLLIPFECEISDFLWAMNEIEINFMRYSESARRSYENIWAESNWVNYYQWLIELI